MSITSTPPRDTSAAQGGHLFFKTVAMGVGAAVTGWTPILPALAVGATSALVDNWTGLALSQPGETGGDQAFRGALQTCSVGWTAMCLTAAGLIGPLAFKTAVGAFVVGGICLVGAAVGMAGIAGLLSYAGDSPAYA